MKCPDCDHKMEWHDKECIGRFKVTRANHWFCKMCGNVIFKW